jgi:hypothetical protein
MFLSEKQLAGVSWWEIHRRLRKHFLANRSENPFISQISINYPLCAGHGRLSNRDKSPALLEHALMKKNSFCTGWYGLQDMSVLWATMAG